MDERTRREIDKATWNTLRDAGIVRPPVPVEAVVEHLQLYRDFYDLEDPSFLDRAKHRIRIHGRQLVNILKKKVKLVAVLLYDEDRILVDADLPRIKWDWATCHEAAHRILGWHRPYFYGDTAQTLDPGWHEVLEAEANHGASALMFCGPIFTQEARDTAPQWSSVEALSKRYEKSLTATLRRYVEHGPERPTVMLVSTPYWMEKPVNQPDLWRYFVCSPSFGERFGAVTAEQLVLIVAGHVSKRAGGPVGDFACSLVDDNGTPHEFHGESFFNRYYILTLFVKVGKHV